MFLLRSLLTCVLRVPHFLFNESYSHKIYMSHFDFMLGTASYQKLSHHISECPALTFSFEEGQLLRELRSLNHVSSTAACHCPYFRYLLCQLELSHSLQRCQYERVLICSLRLDQCTTYNNWVNGSISYIDREQRVNRTVTTVRMSIMITNYDIS